MRALVTGGSGYIGSRLVSVLAARPDVDDVVVLDVRPPAELPQARWLRRSVTEDLTDALAGVDFAAHLAWNVDQLRDPAEQRAICLGGTARFLEACAAANVPHVLFMSSATMYGANPAHAEPVREDEPPKDRWHFQYSAEKREAERRFDLFARERPEALVQVVRPCVVGGPHVSNFIFRSLAKPLAFRVRGADPALQLVHEDEVASAVGAIVESRVPGAFNLAGPGTMRISEAYARAGTRVAILPLPLLRTLAAPAWRFGWTAIAEAPPDFVPFLAYPFLVSTRRLEEETGFRCRVPVEETLDSYLTS